MAYNPLNPNGQASMASSQPVVIASNQSPVSVLATIFGNASISGQVGASVLGTVPVTQTTNPWIITGSVQGSFSPAANQSVSGTVGASIIGVAPVRGDVANGSADTSNQPVGIGGRYLATPGSYADGNRANLLMDVNGRAQVNLSSVTVQVPVVITGGSITASFTPPANQSVSGAVSVSNFPTTQNVSGSVAAFQGTSPWTVVSSLAGGIFPISGSVAATITNTNVNVSGSVVAFPIGNQSVSGAVSVSNFPTTQNVSGSVVATQGTNPWIITGSVQGSFSPAANQSVSGTVQVDVRSSVATVIIGGSIAASFTPPANQSVSGTVNIGTGGPVSVLGTMSVLGTVPVTQSTSPWIITGSVQGSFSPSGNQSVSGTVGASVIGLTPVSVSNFPTTQNVSGSVVATQGTTPWQVVSSLTGGIFPVSGSVAAVITNTPNVNTAGSVVSFQGTSPWVTNFQNSSILAVPVGSTIAVLQSPSIVGTYSEDAAHTSADKGLFVLGVRNDTLSSITSNDGDYSPVGTGPVGEVITANSPITKWVSGTGSMLGGTPVNGGSVTLIAAQGSSVFTYITAINVVNSSANNAWIRFDGATSSIVGFTIAPANGGSNIILPNAWKTSANGAFTASISAVSSVYVTASGFISKI